MTNPKPPTPPAPIAAQTEKVYCHKCNCALNPLPATVYCPVCDSKKAEQVDAARFWIEWQRQEGVNHHTIDDWPIRFAKAYAASLKQETQPPSPDFSEIAAERVTAYVWRMRKTLDSKELPKKIHVIIRDAYLASSSPLETPAATSEDIELIAKSYQNRRERDAAKDLGIDVDEMRKCTPAPADTGAQDTAEFLKGKSVSDFLCPNVASTGDTPQPRNFENQYIGDWNSPYREHIAEKWLIANGCPGPSKTLIELLANFMKYASTLPAREEKDEVHKCGYQCVQCWRLCQYQDGHKLTEGREHLCKFCLAGSK